MNYKKYLIPDEEMTWRFICASGPGGQNVNKVATAVQLHFNVHTSQILNETGKKRLIEFAGNRINKKGELVISAQRFRTQGANRKDALDRLQKFLHRASQEPKKRYKTKLPKSVVRKRTRIKQQHSTKKKQRTNVRDWD